MSPAVRRYAASWAAAGAAAAGLLALLAALTPRVEVPWWQIALGIVAMFASEHLFTRVRYRETEETLSFGEVVLVPLYLFLDPVTAALVAFTALLTSEILARQELVKLAFNLGWLLVGVTTASWLLHLGGAQPGAPLRLHDLALVSIAVVIYGLVNLVAVSGVLARVEGDDPRQVFWASLRLHRTMTLGNLSIGLAAALILEARPLLAVVALVPLAAIGRTYVGEARERQGRIAVTEERDRLDRIVAHASDGIVLTDVDATVQVWNPAMVTITGVPARDAVGERIDELLEAAPAGRNATMRDELEALLTGVRGNVEFDLRRSGGETRRVVVAGNRVTDLRRRPAGAVLVVRDVTREHEVERLRSNFLATVSHELRTPITAILGYARVLARHWSSLDDERRREYVEVLDRQGDRLWRLVSGVLIASEIERGELRPQPTEIDADVLIEEAATSVRSDVDVAVTVEIAEDVVLFADRDHVRDMLLRVLSNAVNSGATTVAVRVGRRGDEVAIAICDDGPGVSETFVPRLFERFTQASAGDARAGEGLGLGLYLVRELATANGGSVTYEPNRPRGACFRLTLPATPG